MNKSTIRFRSYIKTLGNNCIEYLEEKNFSYNNLIKFEIKKIVGAACNDLICVPLIPWYVPYVVVLVIFWQYITYKFKWFVLSRLVFGQIKFIKFILPNNLYCLRKTLTWRTSRRRGTFKFGYIICGRNVTALMLHNTPT